MTFWYKSRIVFLFSASVLLGGSYVAAEDCVTIDTPLTRPGAEQGIQTLRLDATIPRPILDLLPESIWTPERLPSFGGNIWQERTERSEPLLWTTDCRGAASYGKGAQEEFQTGYATKTLVRQSSADNVFVVLLFTFFDNNSDEAALVLVKANVDPNSESAKVSWSAPVIQKSPNKSDLRKLFPL